MTAAGPDRPEFYASQQIAGTSIAKAWGQLVTCGQAEQLADRAIRKSRWPIGNLITIGFIGIFLAVTALAFVFGRR